MLIKIKNYQAKVFLGIYPQEHLLPISVAINLDLKLANEKVLQSKNIADSIDYAVITTKINKLIATNKFYLIEDLAAEIIEICKAEQNLAWCKVEVNKLAVFSNVEAFAVELEYFITQ